MSKHLYLRSTPSRDRMETLEFRKCWDLTILYRPPSATALWRHRSSSQNWGATQGSHFHSARAIRQHCGLGSLRSSTPGQVTKASEPGRHPIPCRHDAVERSSNCCESSYDPARRGLSSSWTGTGSSRSNNRTTRSRSIPTSPSNRCIFFDPAYARPLSDADL